MIVFHGNSLITGQPQESTHFYRNWVPSQSSLEAISRLSQAGETVVLVLDQPSLADGELSINELIECHGVIFKKLERIGGHISAIFYCPHNIGEPCDCADLEKGLLTQVSNRCRTDSSFYNRHL